MDEHSQKHRWASSTGEELHPRQILAWQRMSSGEKWQLVRQANRLLRQGVEGRIRRQFPHLSAEEINRETSRAILLSRA